ncbi:mucin-20 [Orycteropus afer afer]|uniref:Mucin-20 n=1 Tax=Orycteropus afer afer TaxID=1230840 RepID=A0AC54ZDL0_ORYAF|nr:mucin-20 [Orycteropus afer afer]
MGSLWGLALPLFFCCWEAGVPGCSAGVRTNSEGAFHTTDTTETSVRIPLETQTLRTETSAGTFAQAGTTSEAETKDINTISPATEAKALIKSIPYKFMVGTTKPVERIVTSGSTPVTEMTTVETVMGSDLTEIIFDTLCADDSSEEVKVITVDISTLAHTSTEAEALTLESSASSDISFPAIITSPAPEPEISAPAKAWVAYTITDVEVTNCSVIEIETTAIIPGLSDTNHSPTKGVEALLTPEISALSDPTEAKSRITQTTTLVKTLWAASTTESVTPSTTAENPLTTNNTTEKETAVKATTPHGTLATVSTHSLEESAAFSVGTISHIEALEAVTISTEVESPMSKATTPAIFAATVHSPSEVATIKNSTPSETFYTDGTNSGTFPISKGPLPSVHLTTTNISQGANITLAKTTTSAKTLMMVSKTRGKPPTATSTTSQKRLTTKGTAGGDGGFLLLRLSVSSPEDLTDPRVAQRLMQQLCRELHAHMLPIQVSLLHIRRS